jgi:hypothetical protein
MPMLMPHLPICIHHSESSSFLFWHALIARCLVPVVSVHLQVVDRGIIRLKHLMTWQQHYTEAFFVKGDILQAITCAQGSMNMHTGGTAVVDNALKSVAQYVSLLLT